MLKFQDSDGEEDAWGYSFPASIVPLLSEHAEHRKKTTHTTRGVVMAYARSLFRSTNCARTLFNRGFLRRLLLPRCIIGAEGRPLLQIPGKASLSSWSRHRGQISRCSRFCSSIAGIVQSKYTVDIPEVSLSEFMLDDFREYGDDLAMVSWVYGH